MPRRSAVEDPRPLAEQVAEAMGADDSEVAWYFDREKNRVVWARGDETSDEELTADDIDADEARFEDIPGVPESEIHEWMTGFVEARGERAVAALLDARAGATKRFVDRVEKRFPAAFEAWKTVRAAHLLEAAKAWIADAPNRATAAASGEEE